MFAQNVLKRVGLHLALVAILMLSIPASAQNADGEIDNCCYVDRECTTDHEWVNGYWAFQNNQCAAPPQQQAQSQDQQQQNNSEPGSRANAENRGYVVAPLTSEGYPDWWVDTRPVPEYNSEAVTQAVNAILQSPTFVDTRISLDFSFEGFESE